jgi:hypothetical protein
MRAALRTSPRASDTPKLRAARVCRMKPRGRWRKLVVAVPRLGATAESVSRHGPLVFSAARELECSCGRGAEMERRRASGSGCKSGCNVSGRDRLPRRAQGLSCSLADAAVPERCARGSSAQPGPRLRRRRCCHQPHRPAAHYARHQGSHARHMARAPTRQVQCAAQAAQRRQPGPGPRAAAAARPGWQHAFRNAAHRAVAPRRSSPRAYTGLDDALSGAP